MPIRHLRLQKTLRQWAATTTRVNNRLRTSIDLILWETRPMDPSQPWIRTTQGRIKVLSRQQTWQKEVTRISINLATFNSSLRDFLMDQHSQHITPRWSIIAPVQGEMRPCNRAVTTEQEWLITLMDKQSISHYTLPTVSSGKTVLVNLISSAVADSQTKIQPSQCCYRLIWRQWLGRWRRKKSWMKKWRSPSAF